MNERGKGGARINRPNLLRELKKLHETAPVNSHAASLTSSVLARTTKTAANI